jgi:ribosomal protein L16/L10AE
VVDRQHQAGPRALRALRRSEDVAREAMRLAIHKLPFKARFIKREAGEI